MKKIIELFEKPIVYFPLILFVILFSFSYWIYLYFQSEMVIVHDAIGYEQAGKQIFEEGWRAYFKKGPQREPFYLFSIAASMKLGQIFGLHYHHFQKLFQIILLFFAQLLLLNLLGRLRIKNLFKVCTVLYFGVSPAIVNAAFSLFSEIIAYPFVLLAIILLIDSWHDIVEKNLKQIIIAAVLTGLCLLILSFGKGVFRYISVLCYLLFIFQAGILSVKSLNKKYNGQFTFTGNYNFIVLGSAIKRERPITKDILFSHLASIPGAGVCLKFYPPDQCHYAQWYGSIETTSQEIKSLMRDIPKEDEKGTMIRLAKERIFKKPVNFVFFSFIEAAKMFFWESTRIGFVKYPDWLESLFGMNLVRYSSRFLLSLMTIISYFYLWFYCIKRRSRFFDNEAGNDMPLVSLLLLILTAFIGIYSLCYAIPRYSLPIASLYLLAIAFTWDRLCSKSIEPQQEN